MNSRLYNSPAGRVFDIFNYVMLGILGILTVLPFLYIIGNSFATEAEITERSFFLIPKVFSFSAYEYIFSSSTIFRSIGVSIFVTVAGTLVNLFFTLTMAYPLSRSDFWGRNVMMNMVIFSMLFGGGMIPTYLVIRGLGLLDSYWALMLPGAISAFNLIVVKNFFQQMPPGLEEAARIDGCSDLGVLWRIVLPLSKPVIATFALFYAVGHWNNFFSALLYISDSDKWPLQVMLRQIVLLSQASVGDMANMDPNFVQPPEQSIKMAVIVVGTIPILLVYPFLQKHFAKGVMLGSIKG
ncbi:MULTISPECIES: carbohydrate ABC transporter permease [Paenibacillus]|jgi:putative aldouronate transport system permease protein|uniref:Carbohydrate ABC transporter membrane protein 2 (CUT1 family) n=1 Tax=Paenibacillus pabuli TaxID=1472 RepID=A0A855XRR8_9BACL|nr:MULTISPECIES: carbohydrate ABC transporter permease [Paenibacillus]OPG97659.1 ABC transporter permease [Chryseobacterium mucoviscidosis]KGP79628.1 ABC transporter permease [Paenibacillus sp. MAEPY2]KGP84060.1 ABC transporter permease [Paenibacillus sp. MAEPY1]MDN8592380.1 carbohydrate ABC transporter permease [Paenibacillus sp. 11B]MDR9748960.1 carbohydrate ABC transporter permease [Paenibacillus taichungensis]